jgi:hypothetical protein
MSCRFLRRANYEIIAMYFAVGAFLGKAAGVREELDVDTMTDNCLNGYDSAEEDEDAINWLQEEHVRFNN